MTTVLVGITALIIGGVLGGAGVFVLGSTSDSLEDADAKADTGCAMVDRLTEDYPDEADLGELGVQADAELIEGPAGP